VKLRVESRWGISIALGGDNLLDLLPGVDGVGEKKPLNMPLLSSMSVGLSTVESLSIAKLADAGLDATLRAYANIGNLGGPSTAIGA